MSSTILEQFTTPSPLTLYHELGTGDLDENSTAILDEVMAQLSGSGRWFRGLYQGWVSAEFGEIAEREGDVEVALESFADAVSAWEEFADMLEPEQVIERLDIYRSIALLNLRRSVLTQTDESLVDTRATQLYLGELALIAFNDIVTVQGSHALPGAGEAGIYWGLGIELLSSAVLLDDDVQSARPFFVPLPASPRQESPRGHLAKSNTGKKIARDVTVQCHGPELKQKQRYPTQIKAKARDGKAYDRSEVIVLSGSKHLKVRSLSGAIELARLLLTDNRSDQDVVRVQEIFACVMAEITEYEKLHRESTVVVSAQVEEPLLIDLTDEAAMLV